ncbi:translation initiation factor IF-2 [Cyanobacterium stanieri LEGE 03274]|uniref:Translation initiation factor IF-2 n=1 Tax=Cyanobacterium stanieri LEGE 03274 TaxID=1828756 RepID=A0ABR9V2V3_9CHRO|nr:translation initiation factor IF-2 [Cyanobacterium stanieri]MBE9222223.1 translation initiation factor IF-2 [Cyanobacterium stanieri LEGE 03274]
MKNGKIRIYDLSKELALENKDVLEICSQLSIDVKTHSSTISESQAQSIKEAAKNYRMTSSNNKKGKNQDHQKKKNQVPDSKTNKPKLEIVALYKKNRDQEQKSGQSPESKNDNQDTPTLLSPPRPQRPSVDQGKSKAPSPENKSTGDLKSPPPRPEKNAQNGDDKSSFKPELKRPPSPPSAPTQKEEQPSGKPRSVAKLMDSIEGDRKPKPKIKGKPSKIAKNKQEQSSDSDQSQEKKVAQPVATKGDSEKKTIKSPPKPKLQKPPERPVAIAPEPDLDDDLDNTQNNTEDDFDNEPVLLEKPKRTKQKVKKPLVKDSPAVWEDDDDSGKENKKSGKKRRSFVLEDDDDDLIDYLDGDNDSENNLNLALARPDKPASKAPKPADRTKAPRRQKPKLDRSDNSSSNKSNESNKKPKQEKEVPQEITLKQSLTLRELADMLNTPDTEIIKMLFFKGIAVNITETLDLEIAKMVAEELGVTVITEEQKASAIKTEMLAEADLDNLSNRPPVVTIMGHVDHGKTTLLDSIRNTKVVQKEAGGITQHIGAYHVDVEHEGTTQQVVFLDTPGHEAFTAMRARGAKVTDIAILVVAADDGVRPQTREAISHAKAAKVPIVVAINKIDKPEANPDRVKQELSELELVPEDWGGDTVMVPVSALNGENLDALLEMIVLVSEVEDLSANPDRPAKGTVIEAHLDRARGPVATLLVQNGTLRVGDVFVAGSVAGKIRAMIDDRGEKVEEASPSFAVEVLGLNEVPQAGDEFDVYPSEKEARAIAESRAAEDRNSRLQQALSSRRVTLSTLSAQAQQGELKELNIILKADVQGSVEAILGSLKQLPQKEVQIRVLLSSPGEITETDVDLAAASGAVVIGFNTTLAPNARQAAEQEGVDIREYNVIYKLLDEIEGAMEGLLDPEEVEEGLGKAEVRAVFPVGKGAVAGCYVLSGKVVRNRFIRVLRNGEVIYNGNLDSLRRVKDDVKEVASGFECGISINKFGNWKEGDIIEAYEMVFKRRTLSQ